MRASGPTRADKYGRRGQDTQRDGIGARPVAVLRTYHEHGILWQWHGCRGKVRLELDEESAAFDAEE